MLVILILIMNKRIVWIIVLLMSISLIGIIAIQVYWIRDSIRNKRLQFRNNVKIALVKAVQEINEREELEAYAKYSKFIESDMFRVKKEVNNFLFQQVDTLGNRKFIYGTFLDEKYKIPTGFQMPDTTFIRKITSKKDFLSIKVIDNGKDFVKSFQEERFSEFKRDKDYERKQIAEIFKQEKRLFPINKRIKIKELKNTLQQEFENRGINQDFGFGVYKNNQVTPLKSDDFEMNLDEDYSCNLFEGSEGQPYKLYVHFPNEDKNIVSGLYKILSISLIFILIIISVFAFSLYQIARQKKISKIKTDFINNMTHEFKTPIATINLALDAIKNPKIINDEDKVKRYVQMIRDENKRMHGQVESVLRISKLEKKQIEIKKETIDMIDVLEEAVEHINLLVKDKNGTIKTHFKAISTEVLGNQHHLVNVVVNMLENAIKYSKDVPKIDVFAESTNKFFILKIKDEGIGMSKQAQKNAFHKFYREETGNVHNVKGHGLGLAYVKEIINNHHGTVYVESEKGKGSIFTVKLPLI